MKKHWGFKPVFLCSKPHTFSAFSGEEKEKKCPFTLFNKATKELNETTGKRMQFEMKPSIRSSIIAMVKQNF